jgi:hypothetical protein
MTNSLKLLLFILLQMCAPFQALLAMGEVSKDIISGNPDFFPIKPTDYGRLLVISLGTGSSKIEEKYDAPNAAKWGILGWLTKGGSAPIFDVFSEASGDMVDVHLSVVFQALHSEKCYLRIQVFACHTAHIYSRRVGIINTKESQSFCLSYIYIYIYIYIHVFWPSDL